MDGSRFVQEIKDGNIDLRTVKNVNTAAYKDYEILQVRIDDGVNEKAMLVFPTNCPFVCTIFDLT